MSVKQRPAGFQRDVSALLPGFPSPAGCAALKIGIGLPLLRTATAMRFSSREEGMKFTGRLCIPILLFAAGCATAVPAATPAPTATSAPTFPPTATIAPDKAPTAAPAASPTLSPTIPPTKEPTAVPQVVQVIDDFESAKTDWIAGMEPEYGDSSSTSAVLTMDHPSQGGQALELTFEKNDKPKAIFYVDRALDLSRGTALQLDIFQPGIIEGVGVSFTVGADRIWQESGRLPVRAGKTVTLTFDLTAADYKTAATSWEFSAGLADLDQVNRLAVIIYPLADGSVYLDNIVLLGTP
jgi:hypothetical protein